MLSCSIWFSAPSFWMGWWSWQPLCRSCVRCGWCRAAQNHKLQLNIQCSWWWAYVPETCRAKYTSIKLPSCIKLAFHFISRGRCTVKQPTSFRKPFQRKSKHIFFFKNRDVYEIIWRKCGWARQATEYHIRGNIWRVRLASWINKAKETLSWYLIPQISCGLISRTHLDVALYLHYPSSHIQHHNLIHDALKCSSLKNSRNIEGMKLMLVTYKQISNCLYNLAV